MRFTNRCVQYFPILHNIYRACVRLPLRFAVSLPQHQSGTTNTSLGSESTISNCSAVAWGACSLGRYATQPTGSLWSFLLHKQPHSQLECQEVSWRAGIRPKNRKRKRSQFCHFPANHHCSFHSPLHVGTHFHIDAL